MRPRREIPAAPHRKARPGTGHSTRSVTRKGGASGELADIRDVDISLESSNAICHICPPSATALSHLDQACIGRPLRLAARLCKHGRTKCGASFPISRCHWIPRTAVRTRSDWTPTRILRSRGVKIRAHRILEDVLFLNSAEAINGHVLGPTGSHVAVVAGLKPRKKKCRNLGIVRIDFLFWAIYRSNLVPGSGSKLFCYSSLGPCVWSWRDARLSSFHQGPVVDGSLYIKHHPTSSSPPAHHPLLASRPLHLFPLSPITYQYGFSYRKPWSFACGSLLALGFHFWRVSLPPDLLQVYAEAESLVG